jgi:anti-sigma factor RsiW
MDNYEYAPSEDGCPYSWLNEWLCEYVDGTMDPSLQAVFEEYVAANPDLANHIEDLRRTRKLLCQCRQEQPPAADRVSAHVQGCVEGEMLRSPRSLSSTVKAYPVATVASSMVVALVIGMFAGATWVGGPAATESAAGEAAQVRVERPPSQTPSRAMSRRALGSPQAQAGVEYLHSGTEGPSYPLQSLLGAPGAFPVTPDSGAITLELVHSLP